jgi:hypothetical protein
MMNRRKLFTTAALGATALALANCTATQIATAQADWASIVGSIQAAVASAATYIPTVESIAETAAGLFGPTYEALVTAGSAAFNQIVATLTNVVNNLSPAASGRLMARLKASAPNVPVVIGVTSTGVQVTGYKVAG